MFGRVRRSSLGLVVHLRASGRVRTCSVVRFAVCTPPIDVKQASPAPSGAHWDDPTLDGVNVARTRHSQRPVARDPAEHSAAPTRGRTSAGSAVPRPATTTCGRPRGPPRRLNSRADCASSRNQVRRRRWKSLHIVLSLKSRCTRGLTTPSRFSTTARSRTNAKMPELKAPTRALPIHRSRPLCSRVGRCGARRCREPPRTVR